MKITGIFRRGYPVLLVLLIVVFTSSVFAQVLPTQPEGPNIQVVDSSRRTAVGGSTISALAGNVTQLSIVGNTVTQTWQAYYGNVSGTITLDNAYNHTIYDWDLADPEGEIYASESPIDFTHGSVGCYDFNLSDSVYSPHLTLLELETSLGLAGDDADGVDETFTEGIGYDSFYVGSYQINGVCPTTQMYDQNEQQDADKFQEVLLYDNTSNKIVYTAIIEQDQLGFDGNAWDFAMIVGENGHDGDTTTTNYYFYVELE